jgi:hypothetical protein
MPSPLDFMFRHFSRDDRNIGDKTLEKRLTLAIFLVEFMRSLALCDRYLPHYFLIMGFGRDVTFLSLRMTVVSDQ